MNDEARDNLESNAFGTFFRENEAGQFYPRSVLVDLEPMVIDKVKRDSNLYEMD